jgi:hypothetical protein
MSKIPLKICVQLPASIFLIKVARLMNKYLMRTIKYKEWKIDIYQWFAKRRYEVMCHSPSGNDLDYSKISMRCWFKEEFAIDEAKEFIDLITSEQNVNLISIANWDYFEPANVKQVDFSTVKV